MLKIEKNDVEFSPDSKDLVRFTEMGNITEIMYSQHRSKGGCITRFDSDHYVDNRTGEFCEFKHIENRSQDLSSVAKSLKRLRDLLNTNITDVSFCRWVTLTYAENMTDPKRLRKDFEHCISRLRKLFGHFEYIVAAEPQGRGAWHLHAVFIFSHKAPFMPNDVVSDCWKRGFVMIKRLDDVDNVGAYLTAYLGDMELRDAYDAGIPGCDTRHMPFKDVEVLTENGVKVTKRVIKGARLYLYPPKFNIYRKSKGIKEPEVSLLPYDVAKQKASSGKLTFSQTVILEDDENNFKNTLHYEYYNKLRT